MGDPIQIPVDKEGKVTCTLGDFFHLIAQEKRFLNIADTWHPHAGKFIEAMSREGFLDVLSLTGKEHIFLEMEGNPSLEKEVIAPFYNGQKTKEEVKKYFDEKGGIAQLSPEEKRRYATAISDLLDRAKSLGIRVHFIGDDEQIKALKNRHPGVQERFFSSMQNGITIKGLNAYVDSLDPESRKKFEAFSTDVVVTREGMNTSLGEKIRKMAVDNQGNPVGAVTYWGVLHSYKQSDLDEALGIENTVTVAFSESAHYLGQIARLTPDMSDAPDYVYFLNGEVWQGKTAFEMSAKLPPPSEKPKIIPQHSPFDRIKGIEDPVNRLREMLNINPTLSVIPWDGGGAKGLL